MQITPNNRALAAVGMLALLAIIAMFAMLASSADTPVAPVVNTAQVATPSPKKTHTAKTVTSRPTAPAPKPVTQGVQVAADLMVLMALGVLALMVWVPFRVRRWKIESRARYQASGWLSAKDSHDRAVAVRRIQPPF